MGTPKWGNRLNIFLDTELKGVIRSYVNWRENFLETQKADFYSTVIMESVVDTKQTVGFMVESVLKNWLEKSLDKTLLYPYLNINVLVVFRISKNEARWE